MQGHTFTEEKVVILPNGDKTKARKCIKCGQIMSDIDPTFNMVCHVASQEAAKAIKDAFK